VPKPTSRNLRVFLCHSSGDKPAVRDLYRRLNAEGWIDAWLDEEKLLPGQDWEYEIEKALDQSDAVIVTLSTGSVSKEGYVQKELRFVLDIALEKPDGAIFVIPVRLDDCERPRGLRRIHGIDFFPSEHRESAYSKLLNSLRLRADSLEIEKRIAKEKPPAPTDIASSNKNLGRVNILVYPAGGSETPINSIAVDGKAIANLDSILPAEPRGLRIRNVVIPVKSSYRRDPIQVFSEPTPIGRHRIDVEWGGSKPGKASKEFDVLSGQTISIRLHHFIFAWEIKHDNV
jgi:hypothetical protein